MNSQRFFIYARKSTDDTSRQVRSINDQLAEVRELAAREKLEIVDVFIERQTAKSPGRPVFNEMLRRIENGEASGIIAWHPDRLARNSLDGGRIIYLVDTGKIVDLKFPTFRFEPTAQGKFMLSVMFSQSKYYVDNLSENIKRGQRQKLKNGIWPHWAPLGYLNDRATRTIVHDTQRAPLVRKMFEMYATGDYTLCQLRDTLVSLGLRGKLGKIPSVSKIQYALCNPIYHGIIRHNGEFFEGIHEPLISKALFDKCQEIMQKKSHWKRPGHKDFLYRGAIRCGECGGMITMEEQKGHHYLRCTKKKGPCRQPYLREEEITKQIAKAIGWFGISDEQMEKCFAEIDSMAAEEKNASKNQQERTRQELAQHDVRLNRLLTAYLDQAISEEEYRQAKNKLIQEKRKTQEILDEITITNTSWLEPFRKFISCANKATYIADGSDVVAQWDFLRKVGSNLTLRRSTLLWEAEGVWQTVMDKEITNRAEKTILENGGVEAAENASNSVKRRGRDSNPGYGKPHTRFPSVLLQPLGHLSNNL